MRSGAENRIGSLAGVALAGSVPLILFGNALILLLVPGMADVQYALPGFPDDPLGLTGGDRAGLAHVGIRSIWPVGEGSALLDGPRLPDGSLAFRPKEINHMEDVSGLIRAAAVLWLAAVAVAAGALVTCKRSDPARIRRSLGRGARISLVLMGSLAVLMLIGFEFFFDGFHAIFFDGDSWRFTDDFTLRRIYPDAFWGIAAAFFALLVIAQALLLWHLTTGLPRRRRSPERQAGGG